MSPSRDERRVVTFYSFKGGVGCTMSLANVAWRLAARHGLRVIAVDWDLEAPGLHEHLGLHGEVVAQARGVLDFVTAWIDSVEQRTEELPEVATWLVPLEGAAAPPHGSVSVLLAGRLDEAYPERLAAVDWARFYQDFASSVALDALRGQLLDLADVVLIDSRAGLSGSMAACTGALADGVVLLCLASDPSLVGVERVARGIAAAGGRADGRVAPRVWLSPSQVPDGEESGLAREWFRRWEGWFDACAREALWSWDDHPSGLASHRLPYRARWAFGETLVLDDDAAAPDALVEAYDRLAATIFEWTSGALWEQSGEADAPAAAVDRSRREVREAEVRGDMAGVSRGLLRLAMTLHDQRRFDEAIHAAGRSAGIEAGRGNHEESASRMLFAALMLRAQRRHTRAVEALEGVLAAPRASPYGASIASEAASVLEQLRGEGVDAAARERATDAAPRGRRRSLRAVADARERSARADFNAAWARLEQELRASVELGDQVVEARALEAMAEVRFRQMRFDVALSLAQQASAIDLATGRWGDHGLGLCAVARCERRLGRFDAAREVAERSLEVARRCESAWCEGAAVLELAAVHLARGQFEEAVVLAQRALALAAEGMHRECEVAALRCLARVRLHDGRATEARALLEHALRTCRASALAELEGAALRDVADVLVVQQNVAQASVVLADSARLLRAAGARVEELASLQALKPLLDDEGHDARPVALRVQGLCGELAREGVDLSVPSLGAYA